MRYKKPKAKVNKMKDVDGIHQQGMQDISAPEPFHLMRRIIDSYKAYDI
jgi:hypothetical protein